MATVPGQSSAAITIPGADGSDGALTFVRDAGGTQYMTIDLSKAVTAAFDPANPVPSPQPGCGIYDPARWAIIFRYSSVTLDNGTSTWGYVVFKNHPSKAPVVWLVSGDVMQKNYSQIILSGGGGMGAAGFAEPGPGGFRGGRGLSGLPASGGFGPGGGDFVVPSGSNYAYAGGAFSNPAPWYRNNTSVPFTPAAPYANRLILPLIGGSGGSGHPTSDASGGGAGGGAILIAAAGKVILPQNGSIIADGGARTSYGSGGSGGAIRIIADEVSGSGLLYARGGEGWAAAGSPGRIAVQTNRFLLTGSGSPAIETFAPISGDLNIWPPAGAPKLTPTHLTVNGTDIPLPEDPRASLDIPSSDVSFDTVDPVTLHISAQNIPLDWTVKVRVVPKSGQPVIITANPLQGPVEASTTTATFTMPRGIGAIQLRADKPATP
jgi:hypothetical protein